MHAEGYFYRGRYAKREEGNKVIFSRIPGMDQSDTANSGHCTREKEERIIRSGPGKFQTAKKGKCSSDRIVEVGITALGLYLYSETLQKRH